MINAWHVCYSVYGYLPLSVAYFTNKRDAMQYIAAEARELRESGETVIGSAKDGFYDVSSDNTYLELDYTPFNTRNERDEFIVLNSEI